MKMSIKSEYACLALAYLAKHHGEGLIKTDVVSVEQKIPKKFLEQILLQLRRSGYVQSRRGSSGGYQLAKSPDKINLAQIIRLIDGPLAPVESVSTYFYSETPIQKNKKLTKVFRDIRNYVSDYLENTSLADII